MADDLAATPSQVVISWLRHQEPATVPIVAASSGDQLADDLAGRLLDPPPNAGSVAAHTGVDAYVTALQRAGHDNLELRAAVFADAGHTVASILGLLHGLRAVRG